MGSLQAKLAVQEHTIPLRTLQCIAVLMQDVSLAAQYLAGVSIIGLSVSCAGAIVFLVLWALIITGHPRVRSCSPVMQRMHASRPHHLAKPFWIMALIHT